MQTAHADTSNLYRQACLISLELCLVHYIIVSNLFETLKFLINAITVKLHCSYTVVAICVRRLFTIFASGRGTLKISLWVLIHPLNCKISKTNRIFLKYIAHYDARYSLAKL